MLMIDDALRLSQPHVEVRTDDLSVDVGHDPDRMFFRARFSWQRLPIGLRSDSHWRREAKHGASESGDDNSALRIEEDRTRAPAGHLKGYWLLAVGVVGDI